ncbi:MAG: GntR family transcriptional regulator [Acidobacteria bacterium]|nr:GntR family transcriptional regulator [Acidobacteriota bacterium]
MPAVVGTRRNLTAFRPSAPTIRHSVAELLAKEILQGRILPGRRLNESQLARDLDISRAPIREALQQLQEQGLVMNLPRRGMFVVHLEMEDIRKINHVRVVLEAEALRQAQASLTAAGWARLSAVLRRLEACKGPGITQVRLDQEFHRTIWSLTGNEYLERTLNGLVAPVFANGALQVADSSSVALFPHRPLADFVRGRTSRSAEDLMREHLAAYWADAMSEDSVVGPRMAG